MALLPSRSPGTIVATAGVLVLGACSEPDLFTELRPAGPPEVLTVLVMNDPDAEFMETATYCKIGDPKRPGEVVVLNHDPAISQPLLANQVCDPDLSVGATMVEDAAPTAWYVRIVFDELGYPTSRVLHTPVGHTEEWWYYGLLSQPLRFRDGVLIDRDRFDRLRPTR